MHHKLLDILHNKPRFACTMGMQLFRHKHVLHQSWVRWHNFTQTRCCVNETIFFCSCVGETIFFASKPYFCIHWMFSDFI